MKKQTSIRARRTERHRLRRARRVAHLRSRGWVRSCGIRGPQDEFWQQPADWDDDLTEIEGAIRWARMRLEQKLEDLHRDRRFRPRTRGGGDAEVWDKCFTLRSLLRTRARLREAGRRSHVDTLDLVAPTAMGMTEAARALVAEAEGELSRALIDRAPPDHLVSHPELSGLVANVAATAPPALLPSFVPQEVPA